MEERVPDRGNGVHGPVVGMGSIQGKDGEDGADEVTARQEPEDSELSRDRNLGFSLNFIKSTREFYTRK